MYEVWPGYYLKITPDGVIRILYKKQPILLDVEDYFRRLTNINNLIDNMNKSPEITVQKQEIDKTKLTATEYIKMSIKELEEVLKELEDKEYYEKCKGILELINYKKEESENGAGESDNRES